MLRAAGNAPDEMTDTIKIELALHFSINQVTHKGRLAPLLGSGAAIDPANRRSQGYLRMARTILHHVCDQNFCLEQCIRIIALLRTSKQHSRQKC